MLSFPPPPSVSIFSAREPIDMRKALGGLSGMLIEVIDEDPQSGHRFVSFNCRRDRMKSLVWDGSGYWLVCKQLEHGRFQSFDQVGASRTAFQRTSTDFTLLMDGIDLRGSGRRIPHDEITRVS